MDLGALTATLGVDSGPLRTAESQMRSFGDRAESTFGRVNDAAGSCASQLAAIAGVTLSLVGAYELAHKAVSSWYSLVSGGISIVDDYQKKIISTSYILTTMSDVKPPDLSRAYGEWKEYMDWLYRESIRVDKMAAASAQEIFAVSAEMAKKGVVPETGKDVETIGRLTDLMKAVTPTYMNFEQQARGEIQALMEGMARMGAQTAQILSQIDPEFKKNIASAREQGKVLEYIESILPKIEQYTRDLMGTWDAVGASLKSAWSIINIKAFGDAHREVVAMATELGNRLVDNGRLTADGEKATLALARAWADARQRIFEAFDYFLANSDRIIGDIETIASAVAKVAGAAVSAAQGFAQIVRELKQASESPWIGALLGGAAGSRAGVWGAVGGAVLGFRAQVHRRTDRERELEFEGYETAGEGLRLPYIPRTSGAPPVPAVRPFTGKEEKGGGAGGLESAEKSVRAFIETMNAETARGAGDTEAILNAWYSQQMQKLAEWAAKGTDTTKGQEALNAAYYSKLQKLNEDFNDWYIAGLNNQFGQLQAQEDKKLRSVAGNAEKTAMVREVFDRKHFELGQQMETERFNLFKGYYDTMASLAPLYEDQIGFKRQALEVENRLANMALERALREGKITQDTYDQAVAMQAVMFQVRKYNQEMESNKGFAGWAWSRGKEADQRNNIKDMMLGLENGFQNAFSAGLQGVLSKDKTTLKKMGETMFQGLLGEITKATITRVFDTGAKLIRGFTSPAPSRGLIGEAASAPAAGGIPIGGTADPYGLQTAGETLQTAGSGFLTNSQQFGLNAAQFGMASAGLLLSGIGIMTGSQELVVAGTVLQVGAMAIQTAAALLQIAAAMNAIPFFHSGGGVGPYGPVYAHLGWPRPRHDEVDIRAQLGEGVLSRKGMANLAALNMGNFTTLGRQIKGTQPVVINLTHAPTYHYRATQADYNRDAKMMVKAIKREMGNKVG